MKINKNKNIAKMNAKEGMIQKFLEQVSAYKLFNYFNTHFEQDLIRHKTFCTSELNKPCLGLKGLAMYFFRRQV